jgi:hypothetical protein
MLEDLFLDWDVYRNAALALLAGHNPYTTGYGQMLFFNPPWMLVILMPLLVLPRNTGFILNAVVSTLIFIPITRRLKMGIWGYFFIVTSPMHLQAIGAGNVEWLPWCGVFFPAPIAILFYLIKPQATIGIILLTLYLELKNGGWKSVAVALTPSLVLTALWLLLWGLPESPSGGNIGRLEFFPASLIVGLPALFLALKARSKRMAAFAGPFMAPYVTYHGWLSVLFPFRKASMLFVWLLMFIPVLLNVANGGAINL